MSSKTFEKQIEKELEKLTKEQTVHFAWLCALRALPFLSSNNNLNFWNKKEDRQRHLYNIFYALDFNVGVTANNDDHDFDAAANAAATAYTAYTYDAAAAYTAAAYAIAYAAYAAYSYDANSYATATACATHDASTRSKIDLNPIIFSDLKDIQNNRRSQPNLYLYGKAWSNFKKTLEEEGCSYWGQLYQTIFDNGFVLDKKALKQRMSIPPEIKEKGAAEVASYLAALEEGEAKQLNEARILIIGDKGSGKTCLARRLVSPDAPMTTDEESTPGVDTSLWKLLEDNINIHIWDFAGHTVTHSVHQFFLSERCLYIIVYDGRSEERNRLEYWLNHVKTYGGNSKAIILVNKRDQHLVKIPINELREQYPILDVYTFSIRDERDHLDTFRKKVAEYIQNNPLWNNLLIPANYYKVKNELENLFINGNKEERKEFISIDRFRKIAESCGIKKGKIKNLLSDLNDLGICLNYDNMKGSLVLNPEWISYGVYKIINWANMEEKYCLSIVDFEIVFKEEKYRYPENQFLFLFELMRKYELAYKAKEGNVLIIPGLLEKDRPKELPYFPIGESLMARYKSNQPLLPNTISRFIVRHNQQIKIEKFQYLVWRSGVVLDDGNGNIALVREEDRTISVSVKGPNKTRYISTLRETLNDIFNSYKNKKPELQYRIERFGEMPDEAMQTKDPIWLPDRKILTHSIDNVPYYDENTRQQIILNPTVKIYNITAQTLITGQGNQYLDQSIHNTFSFHDCNIGLQGSLNDLARKLTKSGNTEEAEELKDAVELLEEAENCKTKEEVKKKGIARSLQQLAEKLGDEDSKLHKTVEGIKSGIDIAQDIAKGYNDVAQWLGLPQVPKPFLKKETN